MPRIEPSYQSLSYFTHLSASMPAFFSSSGFGMPRLRISSLMNLRDGLALFFVLFAPRGIVEGRGVRRARLEWIVRIEHVQVHEEGRVRMVLDPVEARST